jgi:hypothetical protein
LCLELFGEEKWRNLTKDEVEKMKSNCERAGEDQQDYQEIDSYSRPPPPEANIIPDKEHTQ